jgi:hypothetical protein
MKVALGKLFHSRTSSAPQWNHTLGTVDHSWEELRAPAPISSPLRSCFSSFQPKIPFLKNLVIVDGTIHWNYHFQHIFATFGRVSAQCTGFYIHIV